MQATDWSSADAVARQVLAEHHGVARIDAFLAAGLTRHQIAAIFRRGVMLRARNAWFVDPDVPWQGVHAVRVGGVLTCVSAAEAWGLPVPPESWRKLHVLVAGNASRLRHHRDRTWQVKAGEDAEVETHWAELVEAVVGWRTSLVDTLVQLSAHVPDEWFVAALDAALHRPMHGEPILSQEEYDRLEAVLPRVKRPLLDSVDPLAGSCLETLLRLGLVRRGIGPIVLQFAPRANQFVDFLLPGKLIVEADGVAFHDPEKDAVRDAAFRALGYRVLRFTYDEIVFRIEEVLDRIEAALAA